MDVAMNRAWDEVFLLILVPPTTNIALENNNLKPKPQTETESSPFPTFFFCRCFCCWFCGSVNGGKKSSQRAIRSFPMTSLTGTRANLKVANIFCSLPWYINLIWGRLWIAPRAVASHYVYCLLYSNPLLSLKTLVLATPIGLGRFHRTPRKLTILPVFFCKKARRPPWNNRRRGT